MKRWISLMLFGWMGLSLLFAQAACGTKSNEAVVEKALPDGGEVPASEKTVADAGDEKPEEAVAVEKTPESKEHTPEVLVEPSVEGSPEGSPEKADEKTLAFVASSDYISGSLGVLDVKSQQWIKQDLAVISSDAEIRIWKDLVFVLNRYNDETKEDTVLLYNAKTLTEIAKYSVGAKSNPQDVAVLSEEKAYITLYERAHILIVNPKTGQEKGKIDLSSLAEASKKTCAKNEDCKDSFGNGSGVCNSGTCASDGLPEATKMLVTQDKVYVLIQGLDRGDGFSPVKSAVAVINRADDTLVSASLSLSGTNPSAFVADAQGQWLIAQSGSAFDTKDGGLERFDASKGTMSGSFLTTEEKLGGSLPLNGAIAVVSATLGYVLISDSSFKQSLTSFNPTSGDKDKALVSAADLGDLALHDGQLLLADRSKDTAGIRIFEANTGKELTTKPLSSGTLPPARIVIFSSVP